MKEKTLWDIRGFLSEAHRSLDSATYYRDIKDIKGNIKHAKEQIAKAEKIIKENDT